jgi:6-phosphogluconolactonase
VSSGIFVYVSQHTSAQISVLRMDPDSGALTPVQDVPATGRVMPLAVSPDRRFLYASLRNEPWQVASFAIDGQSGKLTHLGNSSAFETMVNICTDLTGRHLLAAANTPKGRRTGILSVFPIGVHGVVQSPYQMLRTPPKLHTVQPDPTNRYIVGASCDGNAIVRYRFDAVTGAIDSEPLAEVLFEPGRGPRHLQFHPNGRSLSVINEYDASVSVFSYDPVTAALSEIQIADAKPPGFAIGEYLDKGVTASGADIHYTPDGKWLFASVRASLTIAGFAVDQATGTLTSAGHAPAPNAPRAFGIDPLGKFLFAAGDVSRNLVAYRIDQASGALTQIGEYATGDGPNWVEVVRLF